MRQWFSLVWNKLVDGPVWIGSLFVGGLTLLFMIPRIAPSTLRHFRLIVPSLTTHMTQPPNCSSSSNGARKTPKTTATNKGNQRHHSETKGISETSKPKLYNSHSERTNYVSWEDWPVDMSLEEKRKYYLCGKNYIRPDDSSKLVRWSQSYGVGVPATSNKSDINDKLCLFRGDITHLEVDAIVNAANERMLGGGGVDGSIHRAAGSLLKEECRDKGPCPTGEAKITKGYKLPAKHVIHTVGPIGFQAGHLESCYEKCFQLMLRYGLRTIAFCCISTGIYGFPNQEAAEIAIRVTKKYLLENQDKIDLVIFCCFLAKDYNIYRDLMSEEFPAHCDQNDSSFEHVDSPEIGGNSEEDSIPNKKVASNCNNTAPDVESSEFERPVQQEGGEDYDQKEQQPRPLPALSGPNSTAQEEINHQLEQPPPNKETADAAQEDGGECPDSTI